MKSVIINTADCKATAKNVEHFNCTWSCRVHALAVFPIDASINIVMKIEIVLAAG